MSRKFHDASSEEPSSKRARFDLRNPSTLANPASEEREDAILELDEIGKGGNKSKRKAVRLEGYDSDSSEENFDSRADAKTMAHRKTHSKKHTAAEPSDDDMFADILEEDASEGSNENLERRQTKKKAVRFMDENEIEGQVTSSKSGGHVNADLAPDMKSSGNNTIDEDGSSSAESVDDEERAKVDEEMDEELGAGSKKHHAPKLDAFNMRDEAKEGRFDENGNFVRNATDPYAVYDSWLEGSSKAEMRKAKEAQIRREEERRRVDLEDDTISTGKILASLIKRLEKGETTLEALGRLNRSKPRKKQGWQRNRRKHYDTVLEHVSMEDDAKRSQDAQRTDTIEIITASADRLLTRGIGDVYDLEREALLRRYKQETGEEWNNSLNLNPTGEDREPRQWQFRWTDDRDKGEIHGPYEEQSMKGWAESGFFNDNVEFRSSNGEMWSIQAPFI